MKGDIHIQIYNVCNLHVDVHITLLKNCLPKQSNMHYLLSLYQLDETDNTFFIGGEIT